MSGFFFDKSSIRFEDLQEGKSATLNELIWPESFLSALDLGKKSLALLYVGSRLRDVEAYLNFLRSECVTLLMPATTRPEQRRFLEEIYQPQIIYDSEHTLDDAAAVGPSGDLWRTGSEPVALHPKLKLLLGTSGSTGSSKLVRLSQENLESNARSIQAYLPIRSDDVVPLNLPLSYAYGLSVLHANLPQAGCILCGFPDVMTPGFCEALEKYSASTLSGVPFFYQILDRTGFREKEFPALRYLTQAGGGLSEGLKVKFKDYSDAHQIDFFVMYGQTEATARISYLDPRDWNADTLHSVGKPVNRGEIRIDPELGELLYRGPNVGGGYAETRGDLREWFEQEWLRTGDLARIDSRGFVYIEGRLKRISKLFGERVSLDHLQHLVEKLLRQGPVHIIEGRENQLLVCSVHEAPNSDWKRQIQQETGIHGSAFGWRVIDEVPITATGKVDYQEMRLKVS